MTGPHRLPYLSFHFRVQGSISAAANDYLTAISATQGVAMAAADRFSLQALTGQRFKDKVHLNLNSSCTENVIDEHLLSYLVVGFVRLIRCYGLTPSGDGVLAKIQQHGSYGALWGTAAECMGSCVWAPTSGRGGVN